ncbi:MAG: branched-chain amino acid ABC transporter ATP-binding protein/permease [Burkholderiaceae bacterium]
MMAPASRRRLAAVLGAALIAALPLIVSEYLVTLLNYIGLATLVALGLVLLTGVAGQISFGQAAFVGIGAYTTAVLTTQYAISPWLTLPIALVVAAVLAWFLGQITLRMSGHYLPLGTIAWGISLYYLLGNLPELGGFGGIGDIPTLWIFGVELRDLTRYYYLIWLLVVVALWAGANLLESRQGRAIRALKARAAMVESFGVDPAALRIRVFVLAALLAALSGWLYAHMQRFINPTPFSITAGIEYLFMAVIGGSGGVLGALIGAFTFTALKEALQTLLQVLAGESGPYELIVFGALIVLMLHHARDGIYPFLRRLVPARPAAHDPAAPRLPVPERAPDSEPALLSVRGATRHFGGLVAVDSVDFDIGRGEILGLIGPNGAGKSTLFSLISGMLPLSAGEVRFSGVRVSGLTPDAIARLGMARSFQHVKLIGQMSVLDNVAIGASLRAGRGVAATCLGLDGAEERSLRAEAARQLERAGLAGSAHEPAGSLALGQQRVVEIARALCAEPVLLLLDEPAAGLRFQEKQVLAGLLRELRDQGMSILLVEHDMDFVMSLTDRLVVLHFGKKLAEGTPAEIQRNPDVLEAYLGGIE